MDYKNDSYCLLLGDCLLRMKELPDDSVDAIISDIPYGIDFQDWDVKHKNVNSALLGSSPAQSKSQLFKSRGKPKNGWSENDKLRAKEFENFCSSFFKESLRLTKPCSPIIIMSGRQWNHRMIVAAEDVGLTLIETFAWDKGSAPFRAMRVSKVPSAKTETINGDWRLGCPAPRFEPIVWLRAPYKLGGTITSEFIQNGLGCFNADHVRTNILSISSRVKEKQHETQKPEELMKVLVEGFTQPGHTVLDMFSGSGTTGVACLKTGRKFIGIEKEQRYFDVSKKRLFDIENSLKVSSS